MPGDILSVFLSWLLIIYKYVVDVSCRWFYVVDVSCRWFLCRWCFLSLILCCRWFIILFGSRCSLGIIYAGRYFKCIFKLIINNMLLMFLVVIFLFWGFQCSKLHSILSSFCYFVVIYSIFGNFAYLALHWGDWWH